MVYKIAVALAYSRLGIVEACRWFTLLQPVAMLQKSKLDSSRGGIDIQNADSAIVGNLFTIRGSNNFTHGSALFSVNNTGRCYNRQIFIPLTAAGHTKVMPRLHNKLFHR